MSRDASLVNEIDVLDASSTVVPLSKFFGDELANYAGSCVVVLSRNEGTTEN